MVHQKGLLIFFILRYIKYYTRIYFDVYEPVRHEPVRRAEPVSPAVNRFSRVFSGKYKKRREVWVKVLCASIAPIDEKRKPIGFKIKKATIFWSFDPGTKESREKRI